MKEERGVLQDVIGTDQPKESKSKKYVRIALTVLFLIFFAVLLVAAALRKFGS
jgi:hypothetical protein